MASNHTDHHSHRDPEEEETKQIRTDKVLERKSLIVRDLSNHLLQQGSSHNNRNKTTREKDNDERVSIVLGYHDGGMSYSGRSLGVSDTTTTSTTTTTRTTTWTGNHIAPESIKIRGLSSQNNGTITPLPNKLNQLGLIGRDKEIQLLQECLSKYPWVVAAAAASASDTNASDLGVGCAETTTTTAAAAAAAAAAATATAKKRGLSKMGTTPDNAKTILSGGVVVEQITASTSRDEKNHHHHQEEEQEEGQEEATKASSSASSSRPMLRTNSSQTGAVAAGGATETNNHSPPPPPPPHMGLIWIGGVSGTGKTSLAESALHQEVRDRGGLYIKGKFENTEQPFAGIANACDDLSVQLLASKRGRRQQDYQVLHNKLQRELSGEEVKLLLRIIPGLGPILESFTVPPSPTATATKEDKTMDNQNSSDKVHALARELLKEVDTEASLQQSKNHLQFVFQKFLQIVVSVFPIVLILDDLQWADMGSLDILEILVLDSTSSNLMIVGCYRDDEVGRQHPLNSLQKEAASRAAERNSTLEITNIQLKNLQSEDLNLLLSDLLETDQSRTESLAKICYQKTRGNAFFFVRFITMLWQEQLLTFDLVSYSWRWDEDAINKASDACDNVIDFLKTRMISLSNNARHLLLFASCLGTEFDLPTMSIIMEDFYPNVEFQSDLELCLEEGILERCIPGCPQDQQNDQYRWIHDKLMEAAQTLVGPEKLQKLKFCVGAVLLKKLGKGISE